MILITLLQYKTAFMFPHVLLSPQFTIEKYCVNTNCLQVNDSYQFLSQEKKTSLVPKSDLMPPDFFINPICLAGPI